MSMLNLIPGVQQAKLIAIGAMISVVVGFIIWVSYINNQLEKAKKEIASLEYQAARLTENVGVWQNNYLTCKNSNLVSDSTITALQQERSDALAVIASLNVQKHKNNTQIDALQAQIKQMRGDKMNVGTVSPILRETLRGVQEGDAK